MRVESFRQPVSNQLAVDSRAALNTHARGPETSLVHETHEVDEFVLALVGVDDPRLEFGDDYLLEDPWPEALKQTEIGPLRVDLEPIHSLEAQFAQNRKVSRSSAM